MRILTTAGLLLPMICLVAVSADEKPNPLETPVSHVWISKDGSIMLNGIAVQRGAIVKTLKERGVPEDEDILIFFKRGTEVKYLLEVQAALVNAGYIWTGTCRMTSTAVIPGARDWAPNKVSEPSVAPAPQVQH